MTTINSYSRQPTKLDYASPTQFKFNILKLPTVEYFCTAINIPSVSLSVLQQTTPLKDIPVPGEKLTYADLTMSFLVDENLSNYQEIHGWLTGLGFPRDNIQFTNLVNAGSDRFPVGATNTGSTLSDATLLILTNKNNPITEVRFSDLFPVALSGLQYNQQLTDINYLTAEVTFKYKIYEFANVGSSTTNEVTS
jgi:hypothetical protein